MTVSAFEEMRSKAGCDGFVLIEILAALSILAIVAVLMTGFLSNLHTVNRFEGEIAARSRLSATASFLQRTLSGAKPAPLPDNQPPANLMFEGSPDEMRFAAVTRRGFYSLSLRDLRIFVRNAGAKSELVQTLAVRRGTGVAPPPPFAEIVVDNDISSVLFEYADDTGAFSPEWKMDGVLPSAVRMTVSRMSGAKQISATATARIH